MRCRRHPRPARCGIRQARIAGIERTVAVGVEDLPQRRHVGRRAGRPGGEDDLAGLVDHAVRAGASVTRKIDRQDAVAAAGPGGMLAPGTAVHIVERLRPLQRGHVDAVAIEIENDRRGWRRRAWSDPRSCHRAR